MLELRDDHQITSSRLKLIDWRPLRQNTLRGSTIKVEPPGLVIHDCPVHRNGESCYALLPGKLQVDKDGQCLVDDRGKRKYSPVVEIPDRAVRERISAAVVALVRRQDPEALT
jgi:hypothetical protein